MRRLLTAFTAAAALPYIFACTPPPVDDAPTGFDVIIRGGRVLDGSGNPWYQADVGIRGDRIAAVGNLSGVTAPTEVDATGLYVAPGFIDTHSHTGSGLATEELSGARPLLAQGITTVLINPDGGGDVNLVEQRSRLEEHGLGVNVGQMVPHGEVRETVIGLADRAPSELEMERMSDLVRSGMEEGAYGLSSGLFYTPGGFAEIEELVELSRIVADFGGVYQSHIRDESTYSIGLLAAVHEVIRVSEEASLPGVVTHIKAQGPEAWGMAPQVVQAIQAARARGVQVFADQYPYTASSTGLRSALIPKWAQEGGTEATRERLQDPELLPRLREGIAENLVRRGGAERIQFREVESDRTWEGKRLSDYARDQGLDDLDAAIKLLSVDSPSIISHSIREDDIRALMRLPWIMTASDGGLDTPADGVPHPRSYGTFTRKLAVYVLEEEVLDLGSAIRSMTSLPATVFGLEDRGTLRKGAVADVVVFDAAELRTDATFESPRHLSQGMRHVWVNGRSAITNGSTTPTLAGRVLRKGDR